MEPIIIDKCPTPQPIYQAYKDSTSHQIDSVTSSLNRFNIAGNHINSRNAQPSKSNRVLAHLLDMNAMITNNKTPKMHSNYQSQIHALSNIQFSSPNYDDLPIRSVKNQPRISNNSQLPSVFSNDNSQAVKIK